MLALFQNKYASDLLQDTRLLGCTVVTSTLEAYPKFWETDSPIMIDANHYRHLRGIYDITYVVSALTYAIFISRNLVFHVRTKNIQINFHFILDKVITCNLNMIKHDY